MCTAVRWLRKDDEQEVVVPAHRSDLGPRDQRRRGRTSQSRGAPALAGLLMLVLVTAACGRTSAPPEQQSTVTAPQDVQVVMREWTLQFSPPAFLPGPVRLQIRNGGLQPHSFAIEGRGVDRKMSENIDPGKTATFEVNLPAGAYVLYCPLPGHRDRGVQREVKVER